jgi:hypothetical protein
MNSQSLPANNISTRAKVITDTMREAIDIPVFICMGPFKYKLIVHQSLIFQKSLSAELAVQGADFAHLRF